MTPSLVALAPASASNRVFTRSGSDGDWRASNRSWTALDTLLTFCPPAPLARMKLSSISSSRMEIWSVTKMVLLPAIADPFSHAPTLRRRQAQSCLGAATLWSRSACIPLLLFARPGRRAIVDGAMGSKEELGLKRAPAPAFLLLSAVLCLGSLLVQGMASRADDPRQAIESA